MKNKIVTRMIVALAVVLTMGGLVGCGNQKAEEKQSGESQVTESQTVEVTSDPGANSAGNTSSVKRIMISDIDPDQYVKLGDYQSLRVERTEVTVPEDEIKASMWKEYVDGFPEELGVKDRAGALGDAVNIDYEGKKDGVAFDGGTATGYNLTLGSGNFIAGFEDGLVGVMPGETVDLNLVFPLGYQNVSLAGEAVVFTVKVNYVIPAEMMDEAAAKLGIDGVTNVSEFRQHVYDDLYEYYLQRNAEDYENAIYNAFMELCEFKDLPETYLENVKARIEEYLTSSAAQYGMDAETFVSYAYGTDLATFIDYYAKDAAKQNIALYLVAVKEGLIPEDEKLKETALEYATSYGFSDVDSYFQALGATMEEFREDYAVSEAYDLLLEIAGQ